MAGTYFSSLAVNELSGGFTMLLKVDAGTKAPVHAHLGSAEAFLLEGGFYYDADDPGQAGCYTYEAGGAVHEPVSPQGCIMFAVSHGPLGGCDAQDRSMRWWIAAPCWPWPRPTARPAMSYA